MSDEVKAALKREWDEFMHDRATPNRAQWTQDQRWRKDNPGALAALIAYRDGGERPFVPTAGGTLARMIQHIDAWRAVWAIPVPTFGVDMWQGFEWATGAPLGARVEVDSVAKLRAAVRDLPGAVIDGGNRTFDLGGQLELRNHGVMTEIRNAVFRTGRVLSRGGPWRLSNILADEPPVSEEDCVKGEGGGFLHLDRVTLRRASRQGILLAPHTDVVISNSYIGPGGRDGTFDHGIYAAGGERCLIFNSVFAGNAAYQLHFYPSYEDVRVVCCTMRGGKGSMVSALRQGLFVGCEFVGSSRYGIEEYRACSDVTIADCVGSENKLGGQNVPSASVVGWRDEGSSKGVIRPEFWRYVPPTDIAGKPRATADAGAYAL